jgi:flavin-dependent dehydrogenase
MTMVVGDSSGASGPVPVRCDVAVVGGGMAGLAASIHLRRGGLRVVCLEPEPFPHDRVGESLDWSSPSLLAEIGLPREVLVDASVATLKRNIKVVAPGQPVSMGEPPDWWHAPPLRFENVTLHVDRREMDDRLFAQAVDLGVEFLWDRGREVVAEGERVVAVETAGGCRVEASWFIDASGRNARLFARRFGIRRIDYGREKVSFWGYLDTPCANEGTTFYIEEPKGEYLSWIWEIPINPRRASVGCVMAAEAVREERLRGRTPGDILQDRLARFPRFQPLLAERPQLQVRATAYRSFVHARACGPNWLLAGEAAALPDALTANGVTSAFRHASEGAQLILQALDRGCLSPHQRRVYNANLGRMGHMFNHAIETAVYDWPIRRGLGMTAAQFVYVICAFTLNALYTRARPRKWLPMLTFGVLKRAVWTWIEVWALAGRLATAARRPRGESRRLAAAAS